MSELLKPPLNVLIAFPYFSDKHVSLLQSLPHGMYRLIVDSGAFTAWNSGKTILLDDYCRFLDKIAPLRPFNAVQLDVFGEPEGTYRNLKTMLSRGYDVMPVFTRGDTLERLEEFYSLTDYIMFGGITIGGKNQNYLTWFQNRNRGRKVHWLGFCRMDFAKHHKPFSMDSSSWSMGNRFGTAYFYAGSGNMLRYGRKMQRAAPDSAVFAAARRMGLTQKEVLQLQQDAAWEGKQKYAGGYVERGQLPAHGLVTFISAIAFVLLSVECGRFIGTRYFLAASSLWQLEHIVAARQFLTARGIIP